MFFFFLLLLILLKLFLKCLLKHYNIKSFVKLHIFLSPLFLRIPFSTGI